MELPETILALIGVLVVFGGLFNRWVKGVLDKAAKMDAEEAQRLADLEASNNGLKSDLDAMRSEREVLLERIEAQDTELKRQARQIASLEQSYRDEKTAREQEKSLHVRERAAWEKERQGLEQRVELLSNEVDHVRKALAAKNEAFEAIREKLQEAQIDRAALRAVNENYADNMALVMKLADKLEKLLPSPSQEVVQ